ncbi:hypothetical protein GCM10022281_06030 [Sphingomonas rosea]|uniref:Tandem-95 repeat protein n=1 Tax=Sphingomonas rosea TaxID=335605 RepID=A0ABP7TQJ6_9SPHN
MRYEDSSLSGSFENQGPIARDDADQLPAGDRGPATGNVISGAGTQTGAVGADSASGAKITAVAGAGGSDNSAEGGRLRVEGEHGILSLSPRGEYSYTAKAGTPENSRDIFTYTLTDAAGASSQARLTIEIGKTPAVVQANAQRIVPGPDGVVVLPAGVELSDIRIVGRDLLIMLPDGTQMVIVDGAVFVPQLVINDVQVPSTNLAALLIEQEPRPASGVPQSSGGNFIEPVRPLDPGTPLGDLLPPTQLGYTPPEFRDTAVAPNRRPEVGTNPLIQMDDDALAGGNAGGIGDDPNGVNVSGVLSGSGGDGQLTFALATTGAPAGFTYVAGANGSLLVQQNGVTVLTVTLNAQSGEYTVTQNAPIAHPAGGDENNVVFTFDYTVRDVDGDTAAGTFQVNVDDDTPVLAGVAGGAGVTLDETSAVTPSGFPISATSSSAVVVGNGLSYGADGKAATDGISYSISVVGGGATTLKTAQGDYPISLVQTSASVITGTYNDGSGVKTAFTLTIGADGKLTVQQSVALDHPVAGSTAAAYDDSINLNGLVNATITIRDADGDSASASTGIGNLVTFKDDGPSSSLLVEGPRPTLVLDETQPAGSDTSGGSAPTGLASASAGFANSFSVLVYGADGAGSTAYSLVLNGSNVASGLFALQSGDVSTADGDGLGQGAQIVLNQSGNTITGSAGGVDYFTITINPATGVVTFTQLQAVWNPVAGTSYDEAAILNAATGALVVRQTVTDSDGDTASSNLDVSKGFFQIQDDGPIARNDADAVAAGTYGPETGNVITGAGTAAGAGGAGADTAGRDGASVVQISAGESSDSSFDEAGNLVVNGQYGQLSIKADGSYSYVRFAGTPGGVSDSFTYVLRDTDGDTSNATLTIAIGNTPPTLNVPGADAPGTTVFEAALGGTPQGSGEEAAPGDNGDPREATSGTITFSQGDGPAEIKINGVIVTGTPGQVIDTGEGLLTITGKTDTQITYTYVLKDNVLVPGTSSNDTIPVTVTDKDGQVASADLVIKIVDDAPDARNDTDSIAAGSFAPETGNVISGEGTLTGALGKDTVGADGASVTGATSNNAPANAPVSDPVTGQIIVQGQYGTLTINPDGSYSYVRAPGTPGGVSDVFTYTLKDGDGDSDTATLTINIGNSTPEVNAPDIGAAGTVVYEAALGARGAGESQGSVEGAGPGANDDPRETTSGIIAVNQGDGPAVITINGVVVSGVAGQVIDTGEGLLTVTGVTPSAIAYSYTLKDNIVFNGDATDSIAVTVTDKDGQVASDTLTITIVDDAPDAKDDTDALAAGAYGPETGNVISGAGTTSGAAGADIQGADGASVVAVTGFGGSADDSFDADGNLQVAGQYGTLTIKADGSYSYVRNAGSPGGVSDVFNYTLKDADGDVDTAKLTITIGNNAPTVDAPDAGAPGTVVYEAGLPARGAEPAGSGEIADGDAANNSDTREATSGTINYTQGDAPAVVRIEGAVVSAVGQVIDTGEGLLTIKSITAGAIGYDYVLKDNTIGVQATDGGNTKDNISVTVTDADGSVASDTLVITIVDDAPVARADTDSVGNFTGPETGNVITGVGTTSGAAGADTLGADGARVIAAGSINNATPASVLSGASVVIQGQYGQLTIFQNGNYSYTRTNGDPLVAVEKFSYVLVDGDGDTSPSTLTISINDNPVNLTVPALGDASTLVYESALGTRPGEPNGSTEGSAAGSNVDPREAVSGSFSFTAPDGVDSLVVAGFSIPSATFTGTVFSDATGKLEITSIVYNDVTGAGQVFYKYTLLDNTIGGAQPGDVVVPFAITVTDDDGDSKSATLNITIKDDAPLAVNDVDSVGNSNNPATGNVITGVDVAGGDANATDGVKDTQGADGANVYQVASNNLASAAVSVAGTTVITGQYGQLTIKADGSYSYVRANDAPLTGNDVFTYGIKDADGDVSSATLTISINDQGVTTTLPVAGTAGTVVYEAALGARGPGESQGSVEGAAPGANDDPREATSGSIGFTAPDGLGSVTIGGQTFTLGSTFPSSAITVDKGSLVVTGISFNAATGIGSVSYTYTLADNTLGDPSSALIPFTVTDSDGDSSSKTLTIAIVDDAPTARADTDSVNEGSATDGNVISGVNTTSGAAGADTQGADGAVVVGVKAGTSATDVSGSVGTEINGLYGKLILNADGSYNYVANPNSVTANSPDLFTYTIRDADGDTSTTTLTINVVNVSIPADNQTKTVDEAALDLVKDGADLAAGTTTGSNPGSTGETVTGQLNVVGATSYTLVGPATGANGILQLNSNGSYTYTLTSPVTTSPAANDGAVVSGSNVFTYTAVDANGNSTQGTITINIKDDVPTAINDVDSVTEGLGNKADGNVLSGIGGTDANATDGTADTIGADKPGSVVGARTGAEAAGGAFSTVTAAGTTISGTYGDLLIKADGSYVYTLKTGSIPTNVTSETFSYLMQDGDGDTDVAQLTINLVQDARIPSVTNPAGTVYEDGLADGVQHGIGSQTTTGSFQVDLKGETGSVTIGGVAVTNGAAFDTGEGTLTITGVSTVAGVTTYSYSYTLKAALIQAGQGEVNPTIDTVTVSVTDATGDSASGTITISIVDDIPVAKFDTGSVSEGATLSVNAANGVLANDVFGADGKDAGGGVVGIAAGNTGVASTSGVGTAIVTAKGTLTLFADGSYTYVAKPNVISADTTDVFTYTIRDGDGDLSFTTLTIDLKAVTLVADNQTALVNEAALDTTKDVNDLAASLVTGSQPGLTTETYKGTLAVAGGSGISYTPQTVTGLYGQFELKADGSYTYTLTKNIVGAAANNGANTVPAAETFTYVATDANGNTVTGTIKVDVVDDVPTAANDTVGQVAENQAVSFSVFGNDKFGADGVNTADASKVTFTQPAAGTVSYNAVTGLFTFTPAAGQEGSTTFTYTIEDGDGDKSTATVTINLQPDSVPVVTNAVAKVDDDGLAGGIAGGTGDIDANAGETPASASEAVFNGKINVNWGNDAAGSSITFANLNGTTGTVGTETVTYSWSGSTLTATSARGPVFQIVVDPATGNYTLTLLKPILHAAGGGEASALVDLNYRAQDGDGDVVTTGKLSIEFNDDAPSPFTPGSVTTTNGDTPAVQGNLNLSIGADGFGSLVFSAALNGQVATDQNGKTLTVGGQTLYYSVNGATLTAQTQGGVVGYTTTLNQNGTYSFDVQNVISNGTETTFSNLTSSAAGNVLYRGVGADDPTTPTDILLSGSLGGTSQTVNTDSDSIGTANQSMDPGETLRIDLVSNLTSGAATATGFNYGAHVGTTNFDQLIPQVQGAQNQVVSFRVYALNTTLTASGTPDSDPAGGFSDSTLVQVKSVSVQDYLTGGTASANLTTVGQVVTVGFGITATLQSDGSVIFAGVQEGDRYAINTNTTQFNAVVVQDLTGSFDLGIFKIGAVSAGTPIIQVLPVIATDADGDSVNATITATINPVGSPPVALDMNGDGQISYLSHDALVAYDYNGDGTKEATAWVGPQDGLLVRDADGNGTVSGSSEFVFGGQSATDLQSLRAQYGDVLDANDADFAKFAVWQDLNSNGVADAGEVKSLAELGISSINLVGDGVVGTAANGDVTIVGSTSFVRNGSTELAQDAIFKLGAAIETAKQAEPANSTSAVLVAAAAAAAALASAPVAAQPAPQDEHASPIADDSHPAVGSAPAPQAIEHAAEPALDHLAAAATKAPVQPPVGEPVQHFADAGHRQLEVAHADDGGAQLQALDHGTSLPATAAVLAPASFAGGEIQLPSADQLAALMGKGEAIQHNPALEQVLSDALAGGAKGPDLDQLIGAAIKLAEPVQHQPGHEMAAVPDGGVAALATQLASAVPSWDAGHAGAFVPMMAAAMESPALHPDAVQPVANG